jgi:patatin-like phospholipase/acyl hydrolase
MRGIYTASYISHLAQGFSAKRGVGPLDVGAGFDLIVGTSTGAIIGCALAAGVSADRILRLYRDHGHHIFRRPVPAGMGIQLVTDLKQRPAALRKGELALRRALTDCLTATTIGDVYHKRNIALAITAVDMSRHRSWVFKTPHDSNSNHRDDGYTLVEICLASSAAPIFRSLAAIDTPGDPGTYTVFADGGMWANSPVLVALIEALGITNAQKGDRNLLPWHMSASRG